MSESPFSNKAVVIAGSGSELDAALGRAFAEAGSRVVIVAVTGGGIVSRLDGEGLALTHTALDARDPVQSAALVERLVEQFGRIDVWINSFPISRHGPSTDAEQGPAESISSVTWDECIGSTLSAAFFCCQAAGRQMLRQGNGVIVNLTSVSGRKAVEGDVTRTVAYAGLASMTNALGVEWAGRGVRVVGVALPLALGVSSRRTPLRQPVTAQQIAEALLYLTSDEAAYVTAETLVVDGGWSAYQLF